MNKFKRVCVKTAKGDRFITFKPVPITSPDQLICDDLCPYSKVCDKLCDPRRPEDKQYCFADFCGSIGENEDGSEDFDTELSKITEMVPVEGTIEEAFSDFPGIFQQLTGKDPLVRINTVIDKVCSGWCEFYDPTHCNCNESNKVCMLHDLFMNISKKK